MVAFAATANVGISYVFKVNAMSPTQPCNELQVLEGAALQLSEMEDFNDVKKIRDRAEAARKYAQTAAYSLEIQNRAAELKLRAERRAGQILNELLPHGGNRRSRWHHANLKLSDLGINATQSARWRREAAVPEIVFERYVSTSNRLRQDITAQGLLRLSSLLASCRARSPSFRKRAGLHTDRTCRDKPKEHNVIDAVSCSPANEMDSAKDIHGEITNHRRLLGEILNPFCNGKESKLAAAEKRLILRLLAEINDLLQSLEKYLPE